MTFSPSLMAARGTRERTSCSAAEVLEPEVDGLVDHEGRSVVTTAALNRGPRNGFSTMSPMRHISPSPAQSRMGGTHHLVVPGVVGARGVAQPADVVGQDAGDEARVGVGEEAHGVADPVVALRGLRRFPVLVHDDRDGVLVVEVHARPSAMLLL